MHFSLKRQWERKNLLLRWKTYPKSTQGVDFSKLLKLMMEGWEYYVSEWLFSLVIAYPKHKFNTLSCVRGKWENSTLNSLMSNKILLFSIFSESPKLQVKLSTSCPIICSGHEKQQFLISLKNLKFPQVLCSKAYQSVSPLLMACFLEISPGLWSTYPLLFWAVVLKTRLIPAGHLVVLIIASQFCRTL